MVSMNARFPSAPDEAKELISKLYIPVGPNLRPAPLPSFIPIVPLDRLESHIWKHSDEPVEALIVRFEEVIDNPALLPLLLSKGIHDFLDFDGTIIVSSIMRDNLLRRPLVYDLYRYFFRRSGADLAIAWDSTTYSDMPSHVLWKNVVESLRLVNELVRDEIPTVGIINGADAEQLEFSASHLSLMGVKDQAVHCSEYMYAKDKPEILKQMFSALDAAGKYAERVFAIGIDPYFVLSFSEYFGHYPADLVTCNMSWFLQAEQFKVYSGVERFTLYKKPFTLCDNGCCQHSSPDSLSRSLESRARHNFHVVRKITERGPVRNVRSYGLVLEKHQKLIVAACLHIGTPESRYEACLEFLKEQKPKYIVFLGDTFDLVKGRLFSHHLSRFYHGLKQLSESAGTVVIPVLGSHDPSMWEAFKATQRLLFTGSVHPLYHLQQIYSKDQMDGLFSLYRFYSLAVRSLDVRLPNGSLLLLDHGTDALASASGLSSGRLASRSPEMPQERLLHVRAHIHKAFFDWLHRVAFVGCWQSQTGEQKDRGLVPDVGAALVVEGDLLALRNGRDSLWENTEET